mgnify:CR=1 FL=1
MVGSCAPCSSSHDAKLHDRKHRCRNACTTPHPGAQTPEGTVRALAGGPLVARAGSGRPEGATYQTVSSVAEGLQRGPPADGSKIAGAHAETARPDTAGQGYPPGCDAPASRRSQARASRGSQATAPRHSRTSASRGRHTVTHRDHCTASSSGTWLRAGASSTAVPSRSWGVLAPTFFHARLSSGRSGRSRVDIATATDRGGQEEGSTPGR